MITHKSQIYVLKATLRILIDDLKLDCNIENLKIKISARKFLLKIISLLDKNKDIMALYIEYKCREFEERKTKDAQKEIK